jgi:hypothetical protein
MMEVAKGSQEEMRGRDLQIREIKAHPVYRNKEQRTKN